MEEVSFGMTGMASNGLKWIGMARKLPKSPISNDSKKLTNGHKIVMRKTHQHLI
jgi:hypothetical protein